MGKEESEFGRGLIVNLVKFFEHFDFNNRYLRRIYAVDKWIKGGMKDEITSDSIEIEYFKKVELKSGNNPNEGLSSIIELWMNGASDHLYEIIIPKQWQNTYLAKRIRKLRALGLTIGHGFTGKIWTVEDITTLRKLVENISLDIDKRLGIHEGDWGQW